jgi:hypothetical protein
VPACDRIGERVLRCTGTCLDRARIRVKTRQCGDGGDAYELARRPRHAARIESSLLLLLDWDLQCQRRLHQYVDDGTGGALRLLYPLSRARCPLRRRPRRLRRPFRRRQSRRRPRPAAAPRPPFFTSSLFLSCASSTTRRRLYLMRFAADHETIERDTKWTPCL